MQRCAQIRRCDCRIARPYKAKRAIRESPLQNGGRYVPAVGHRLSPAVRIDRQRKKKPRRVRDSEPRFALGWGADAGLRWGAKPVQSPRALEGMSARRTRRVRDSEPALRRDGVRLRRCGGAQSQSKARGLWRGSNRQPQRAPKKKDGFCRPFSLVHLQGFEPGTH